MKERNEGGIKCSQIIEILDAYISGDLEPEISSKIQVHLQYCDNCSNFGQRYATMLDLLKNNLQTLNPSIFE